MSIYLLGDEVLPQIEHLVNKESNHLWHTRLVFKRSPFNFPILECIFKVGQLPILVFDVLGISNSGPFDVIISLQINQFHRFFHLIKYSFELFPPF